MKKRRRKGKKLLTEPKSERMKLLTEEKSERMRSNDARVGRTDL